MPRDLEPDVTLPWLVRLRWLVLLGQLAALLVAWQLDAAVHAGLYLAAIAVSALSNALLALGVRPRRWSLATVMGGVLVLDVVLLTALLAASGGAVNPFTVLYLVHITLSAVVLSAQWTVSIAALSVACFGLLFLLPAGDVDPHAHHLSGGDGLGFHLFGMWVAFALAAALTAFFVQRIARAIAAQREQIASLREAAARNARLAALTTLAAGAAHELGSPLATIAVAAHEARLGADGCDAIARDLELIELEVERCRDILQRMAARAADPEAAVPVSADELTARILDELGAERAARLELLVDAGGLALHVPTAQLVQSVVALIRNALDASAADQRVTVTVAASGGAVRIAVEDRGSGIPGELLGRVGEPFFTTKQPGRGLGLGVFLARCFFESRGGTLAIESTPGVGTRALVSLPRATEAA